MEKDLKHISKLISLVLRHKPDAIGTTLDPNGWVPVDELIEKINKSGTSLTIDTLHKVVDTNDKQRFSFNEDATKIRANQGHSIDVDLNLKPVNPPEKLYHGTADRFVDSILKDGIKKQSRQFVHLSLQTDTANSVGSRHGKPIILSIDAKLMYEDGFQFFVSENGVWLTEEVPASYISK